MRKTVLLVVLALVGFCLIVAAIIAGGLSFFLLRNSTSTRPNKPPAEIYQGLRKLALEVSASELGLKLEPNSAEPYGVLMEMNLSEGVATLTSFATGDASLYFSRLYAK